MFRGSALVLALAMATIGLAIPAPQGLRAQGRCEQCDLPPSCRENAPQTLTRARPRNCQKLNVEIDSDIDFGRVVVLRRGEGSVLLDLESGTRQVLGDIDDLGGMPITGRATIRGAPFEALRISLPSEISMRDTAGGQARMREFVTDLPALPTLDANGQLSFRFSATLVITADAAASGKLRGRVPISVEYQ